MNIRYSSLAAFALFSLATGAHAGFHFMQIEQVIGGVDGNNAAQAVQLRTRTSNQHNLSSTRLVAWDANGANPVLLFDFLSTYTPAAQGDDSILLTTSAFTLGMQTQTPSFANDFTLTNAIPASYLSGGKITFGNDTSTAFYWSLAFGAYLGANTGTTDNDADGNFGSPYAFGLPTSSREAVRFTGAFGAQSTTNAANYTLVASPATVRNASGNSFTVVPEPGSAALLGAMALGAFAFLRRRS